MPVTVNLASETEGVLKNFLSAYFEKDIQLDEDVCEWINVFSKPLDAIDLITSVIDNSDNFNIELLLSMDRNIAVRVDHENINDIIKFMLFRYYKENSI